MKKFLLVPQTQLPSPLVRKLGQLDAEMKTILDRTDLDDYEKARAYSTTLEKYLDIKQQLSQPQQIPLVEKPQPAQQQLQASKNIDLSLFPKSYRSRAGNLLNHVQNNTDLSWNDRGEILVDGSPVVGSHIVDLVDDVIRVKKGKPEPVGSSPFVQKLQTSNVPQSLIGNKDRFTVPDDSFVTPTSTRTRPLLAQAPRKPNWSPRGRGLGNRRTTTTPTWEPMYE